MKFLYKHVRSNYHTATPTLQRYIPKFPNRPLCKARHWRSRTLGCYDRNRQTPIISNINGSHANSSLRRVSYLLAIGNSNRLCKLRIEFQNVKRLPSIHKGGVGRNLGRLARPTHIGLFRIFTFLPTQLQDDILGNLGTGGSSSVTV